MYKITKQIIQIHFCFFFLPLGFFGEHLSLFCDFSRSVVTEPVRSICAVVSFDLLENKMDKGCYYGYFHHSPPIFQISSTQTMAQIKSQKFIGHIKTTLYDTSNLVTYATNGIQDFVKCCIKS